MKAGGELAKHREEAAKEAVFIQSKFSKRKRFYSGYPTSSHY